MNQSGSQRSNRSKVDQRCLKKYSGSLTTHRRGGAGFTTTSSTCSPASRDDVARLDDAAAALPEDLRAAIREKIHEFAGRNLAVTARRKRFRRADWQR